MGNAIVSLICAAVLLVGVMMMTQSSLSSVDQVSASWRDMEERAGEVSRTSIDAYYTRWYNPYVEVRIENDGQVPLSDFESWDVMVQYTDDDRDYRILWLSYDDSYPPGNDQWAVLGIYENTSTDPEIFEPGIFNEGEYLRIRMRLEPEPRDSVPGWVTVATPNGVSTSIMFER